MNHNPNNHSGIVCPTCGSNILRKCGKHLLKSGIKKQKYLCSKCCTIFSPKQDGFKNMISESDIVVQALALVLNGCSYRKAANHIFIKHGKKISHSTLISWMLKYTKIMKEYLNEV